MLKKGQMIVFEGDSYTARKIEPAKDTWPYLRLNNWDTTYADRVSEWLFCNVPELDLHFRTSAVGGSTIQDVLRRYESAVKPLKPNLLIMSIGTNDVNRQIAVEDFRKSLEQLCGMLQSDFGARLVWVDVWPQQAEGEKGKLQAAYRESMRQVLAKYNGVIVPAGEALERKEAALKISWKGHTVRSGEDGHLNAVGAEIVSAQVLQALGVISVNQ